MLWRPVRSGRPASCVVLLLVLGLGLPVAAVAQPQADPLPSWNAGSTKQAIVDFVHRVTTEGGPDFIPAEERIAVFDHDGTLWQEQPVAQGAFVVERVKALVAKDPSLAQRQPWKALSEGDFAALAKADEGELTEVLAATHAHLTQEQFHAEVRRFLRTARHPRWKVPYTALTYQPMLELLAYLRENGFQTWISSGGGIDFMRVFSEEAYGIPPQQVIGSSIAETFEHREGKDVLWRRPHVDHVNDKAGKPVGNDRHIGREPVFVAGNVRNGGDLAMLSASAQRGRPSFQLLVNHDDPVREFAYQEEDGASLDAAKAGHWTVVSMRDDWKTIFSGTR